MTASTLQVLDALVGFDTTSRESNLHLVGWVEDFLADLGVDHDRIPASDGRKAGLLARVGPDAPGGIMLCGHTDTVPVDGQEWSSDPFTLTRRGDRVLGRGVVDMKGFIAAALAAAADAADTDLRSPLWLGLTCDEEVGCLGAPPLVDAALGRPHPPEWTIIGEATNLRVARAHKGIRAFRTTITGRAAHSSRPDEGASAVSAAARLVAHIDRIAQELAATGVRADGFDPPHTTLNVGTIRGGVALNIVPRECEVVWEFRHVPGEDPDRLEALVLRHLDDEVLPRLRERWPAATAHTEELARVAVLEAAGNGLAATALRRITGAEQGSAVSYGTDGGVLQAAGLPCVVWGPGDPAQMHQHDESIALADLEACDAGLAAVVAHLRDPVPQEGPWPS